MFWGELAERFEQDQPVKRGRPSCLAMSLWLARSVAATTSFSTVFGQNLSRSRGVGGLSGWRLSLLYPFTHPPPSPHSILYIPSHTHLHPPTPYPHPRNDHWLIRLVSKPTTNTIPPSPHPPLPKDFSRIIFLSCDMSQGAPTANVHELPHGPGESAHHGL